MASELLRMRETEWRRPRAHAILWLMACAILLCAPRPSSAANVPERKVFLRDITQIEGVRENQLVGYGLVVGLDRSGDTQQTFFTVQTLANALLRLGVQIPTGQVVVKDVAAVFVTAQLPPFARAGMKLDVTVSAVGDAKSIEGGVLLLTALRAANGQVYAEAQGPLVIGGYSEGANGNVKTVNHVTVGRIAGGASVERDAAVDLTQYRVIPLLLNNPDFTTASNVVEAVDKDFGKSIAKAIDSRRIDVDVAASGEGSVPDLISRIQNLSIEVREAAKVIVNERTGTIVMGGDVKLSPVSVIHGSLTINIESVPLVSQPLPNSAGKTEVVDQTKLTVTDQPAQAIELQAGANVDELIRGLRATGATSRDIIAILQAIKAAGGLEADLEVI
jgi:flagellar P-ring protein FlgI